jgi:RecG-like helicase
MDLSLSSKPIWYRVGAETVGVLGDVKIGLVHGKMAAVEKHEALEQFQNGNAPVLVATTVVEVQPI